MKVTIQIHNCLSARDILSNYDKHSNYFSHPENSQGIYFHVYKKSKLPFYIGISDMMLKRNLDHLELYQKDYSLPGDKYWLAKDPERLYTLDCFKKDTYNTYDFYSPNRPDDVAGRNEVIEKLLDNMDVLFSRLITDEKIEIPKRQLIEQVERQLQDNMIKALNIYPDWIGRTGSNRGGGLDDITHELKFEYAPKDYPILDSSVLSSEGLF